MSFWTDERVQVLRDLAPTHSCGKIAARLGCTRNAVIGKAARIGVSLSKAGNPEVSFLPLPTSPFIPPQKIVCETKPPPPKIVIPTAPKPLPKIVCEPVALTPKVIGELSDCDCAWPLGDPMKEDFRYCGAPKADRRYCASHAKMSRGATKPASARPILKRSRFA